MNKKVPILTWLFLLAFLFTSVVKMEAQVDTITTYTEDFENPVSLDLWRPNTVTHADGTPVFDVTQTGGVLHTVVNQDNFWDGQNLNFTANDSIIFDITDNPYITFDVKVEPGATYGGEEVNAVEFLVSPWGWNDTLNGTGAMQREFLALTKCVPADGQWHTMKYDISLQFGKADWNGDILQNDYSEIQTILIESVIWPDTFDFVMEMDNFRVGEAAAVGVDTVTTYLEDFECQVNMDQWRPNMATHPDGHPVFESVQAGGALVTIVDQANFWDGQFLNFTKFENKIIDITDNPYITFDVKVEPGATYGGEEVDAVEFLVSPWGWNDTLGGTGGIQREFLALNRCVPADGQWHTMKYDISLQDGKPDWNGDILQNDFSEIQAVLVESVIWPDTFDFNMQIDNFRMGAAAAVDVDTVTAYIEDFECQVNMDQWRPNTAEHPDGTPAFNSVQAGGVIVSEVSQANFWDGQFFNFRKFENIIIDFSAAPYIQFDVKIEEGATYDSMDVDKVPFLVSPWGWNDTLNGGAGGLQREFLALQKDVPDDGEWHTVQFDISEQFGKPDWNGDILQNDYTEIEAVLVENVIWPDKYIFNMQFDNFKIGGDIMIDVDEVSVEKLSFYAFPNPVSNELVLRAEETLETVRIFDMLGRLHATYRVDGQKSITIDMSNLHSGIYLVEAKSANKINTKKILKN